MDLDEVETAEKKTKKKDKKKRTAAEVEADIGDRLAAPIPAAACILTSNTKIVKLLWHIRLRHVPTVRCWVHCSSA